MGSVSSPSSELNSTCTNPLPRIGFEMSDALDMPEKGSVPC
jgi:hypothetical protein